MRLGNIPQTYSDVLALVEKASVVTFYRPLGAKDSDATVDLTIDDFAADRRTCVSIRMASSLCGVVEVKTLHGYQPVANRWTDYCAPSAVINLPDRRGQKALLATLAAMKGESRHLSGGIGWTLFRKVTTPAQFALS